MNTVPQATVYTRSLWSEEWSAQPLLFADHLLFCCAPELSSAQLHSNYGRIIPFGETAFQDIPEPDYLDMYVKVVLPQPNDQSHLWYGIIKEETELRRGGNGTFGGVKRYRAYGMEYLLMRSQVSSSFITTGDFGSEEEVEIQRAIAFNLGQGDNRRGRILGNRSILIGEKEAFVFSSTLSSARMWSAYDIVDYLLKYHGPRNEFNQFAVPYKLDSQLEDQLKSLDWWKLTLDMEGRTVKETLDAIMSRQRLISYVVTVDEQEGGDIVLVKPFTFSSEEIELTEGNVIAANPATSTFSCAFDARVKQAVITRDRQSVFDIVIARGDQVGVCWTMEYAASNATTEPDWESALQAAYNDGSPSATGTNFVVDVQLHRNYRNTDKFERAYRYYRVPLEWNGKTPSGTTVVIDPDDASIAEANAPDKFWRPGLTFEPYLPLRTDIDYSYVLTDPPESTPTGSLPELRRPFAVHYVSMSQRAFYLDKPEAALHYGASPETGARHWGCTVRPQDNGLGIILDVQGAPQHAIAKDEFVAADDADEADWKAELRWQDIYCTVFMRLDRFAEGMWPDTPSLINGDAVNPKVIYVPNKRANWLVPDTIVDVDDDGALVRTAGGWIEDDRDELTNIAKAAYQWYSRERRAITVSSHSLQCAPRVGWLITTMDGDEINSVVTQLAFDLRSASHVLQTQFAEFDVRGL